MNIGLHPREVNEASFDIVSLQLCLSHKDLIQESNDTKRTYIETT